MRKQLTVNLGAQHDAWVSFAQKHGQRPATLAAEVCKAYLEQHQALKSVEPPETCAKRGLYIRLHEDELERLDEIAARMQRSRQHTIMAILRAASAAEPQFALEEQKALVNSNYQLSKIGVNLNQIAHRVNALQAGGLKGAEYLALLKKMLERTDKLTTAINSHAALVWKLINAGRYRLSLRREKEERK